jgi:GT2 family glycosyltransferase
MNLSILVVLYNSSIPCSRTITSLLDSNLQFKGCGLCIWNNGPNGVNLDSAVRRQLELKGFVVTLRQTPGNIPLSYIYNDFFDMYLSEYYVILDHDSILSEPYLRYLNGGSKFYVGMPIISSKGINRSPCLNGRFSSGPYVKKNMVTAIGSGLVISRDAASAVKERYGNIFDERFALYGVDTTFFVRLNRMCAADKLRAIPGFEHSLSRLEQEGAQVKSFRAVERSYDIGLMLRYYPSLKLIAMLVKQLLLVLLNRNQIVFSAMLKAFIAGKHERCIRRRSVQTG